ncbi:MAG: GNAT family N-acetyltransferase [Sphingomonadales bacterium]|nr:MAG: GNAT family N-acetyltransferase [Sphingomonadales bacterium]
MKAQIFSLTDPAERYAALPSLARLRLAVFREWPYLYDGTETYEETYLREFMKEPGSVLVIAKVDGKTVGAATASPMTGQKEAFRAPFIKRGFDMERLFYFGESVLLSEYRGLGIGHSFFEAREAAARAAGATHTCFCAVVRPANHPLRPEKARDLHPFWRARGYTPMDGMVTDFDWKDIDQPQDSAHPMQYWIRAL